MNSASPRVEKRSEEGNSRREVNGTRLKGKGDQGKTKRRPEKEKNISLYKMNGEKDLKMRQQ